MWQSTDAGGGRWNLVTSNGLPSNAAALQLAASNHDVFAIVAWSETQELGTGTYSSRSEVFKLNDGNNRWERLTPTGNAQCSMALCDDESAYVSCDTGTWRVGTDGSWRQLQQAPAGDRSQPDGMVRLGDQLVLLRSREEEFLDIKTGAPGHGLSLNQLPSSLSLVRRPRRSPAAGPPSSLDVALTRQFGQVIGVVTQLSRTTAIDTILTSTGSYFRRGSSRLRRIDAALNRAAITALAAAGSERLAAGGDRLYVSPDHSATWLPGPQLGGDIEELAIRGNEILALIAKGPRNNGSHASQLLRGDLATEFKPLATGENISFCVNGNRAAWLSEKNVWLSASPGMPFQAATPLPADAISVVCLPNALIASVEDLGVVRLLDSRPVWEPINDGLDPDRKKLIARGNAVFAILSNPHDIYQLDNGNTDTTWRKLTHQYAGTSAVKGIFDELNDTIYDIWMDPKQPAVLLESRHRGLAWSNDGGNTFHRQTEFALTPVMRSGKIADIGGTLYQLRNGIYELREAIPRPFSWAPALRFARTHLRQLTLALAGAFLFVFCSTRSILLLLELDVYGIRVAAAAFYATIYGRHRLYAPYRRKLQRNKSLEGLQAKFVDIPYRWDEAANTESTLIDRLARLGGEENIAVTSRGGGGKTTICWELVAISLQGRRDRRGQRQPILVEGFAYGGDLKEAILGSLKKNNAALNEAILEQQLALGQFLVILDGYSEIRSAYLEGDLSEDIKNFVAQWSANRYVFTSRTRLPEAIRQALNGLVEVELLELDRDGEQRILEKYLLRPRSAEQVQARLADRYHDLPRLPLMLRLVAAYYNKNGAVPQRQCDLFSDFTRELLRPEAVGLSDVAGIHYAVEQLVRGTFLEHDGDRGFVEEDGIDLLIKIQERLVKGFGIDLTAMSLLRLLAKAGLLRSSDRDWRFFHDSFESYYAARALESAYKRREYKYVREKVMNPKLEEVKSFLQELLGEDGMKAFPFDAIANEGKEATA